MRVPLRLLVADFLTICCMCPAAEGTGEEACEHVVTPQTTIFVTGTGADTVNIFSRRNRD
jgi:hypothetical protein